MKRNNKSYGQIKEEVREAEAVKRDFAKAANMEYRSRHNMTGEQKYHLLMAVIGILGGIGIMLALFLPFVLG